MLQTYLVDVLRSFDFFNVEIDDAVVAQIDQKLRKPLVLQDGGKKLEAPDEFSHQSDSELAASDGSHVLNVHEGDASVEKAASRTYESKGLLEGYLDELRGREVRFGPDIESDLVLELFPYSILVTQLLILDVALLSEQS